MEIILKKLALAVGVSICCTSVVLAERDARNVPMTVAPTAIGDDAIVDNGTIQLGINDTGSLNVPGSPSAGGTPVIGLRYLPTNNEATGAGCACEGWGVADAVSGVAGYANESQGTAGMTVESFEYDADSATSIVNVGDVFRVTHYYHPSSDNNLYQVDVTIENISEIAVDNVLYRRVMDWDIEPTAFSEYVTIKAAGASNITFTSDDGFASANPLAGPSSILFTGDATDSGAADHGALFDFDFGYLEAGATKKFTTYYGAANSELAALTSLANVGAEAYSFGQPSSGKKTGEPNTFVFAFGGIGGTEVSLRTYGHLTRVDDINGNGIEEVAVLTTQNNGNIQVVVKDPTSIATLKIIKFLNSKYNALDITAEGTVISVLAYNKSTGVVLVESRDVVTGLQAYPKKSIPFPPIN